MPSPTESLYMLLRDTSDERVFRHTVDAGGGKVFREIAVMFTDGTYRTQFIVRMPDRTCWLFTPASGAILRDAKRRGRWLSPYMATKTATPEEAPDNYLPRVFRAEDLA